MDPRRRQELTRYGAPAAFLAAVTIVVILIKSGLNGGSGSTTTVGLSPTTTRTATATTTNKLVLTAPLTSTATITTATTATTATTTPGAQYYVVQSGDTLGSIAQKYNSAVADLMTLNPGIDPTALHIGQKIRVK
ncbi:MAG TPA: LysM domain-containing protein [Gaiellaceae bacterium]|nr:LysM domain-containing protein [Gaiellaceae bacterium]